MPRGAGAGRTFRASGQILEAAVIPLVLLVLAGVGVLATERPLRAGVWVSVVTPRAVRPTRRASHPSGVVERAALVAALVGLGALVVLLKTLAH